MAATVERERRPTITQDLYSDKPKVSPFKGPHHTIESRRLAANSIRVAMIKLFQEDPGRAERMALTRHVLTREEASRGGQKRRKKALSPQHRENIGKAFRGRKIPPEKKRTLSPKHKESISKAFKGKGLSEEHKTKISLALNGDNHDRMLWNYAKRNKLFREIVEKGFLTREELRQLSSHFNDKGKDVPIKLESIFNRFSRAVANLA